MKLNKYLEFVQADFEPIKSFYLKDELNPKIWTDFEINSKVREQLLQIALDFFNSTDIKTEVVDVVLCGSLCNYNWSEKYSDYDLHIIVNLKNINEDLTLAEQLCDFAKKIWNSQHDIKILNYEVEVAIQDKAALSDAIKDGRMGGVYSLKNDTWVKKPIKADFEPDEDLIRSKAETVMDSIDGLENEAEDDTWDDFNAKVSKVWKRVKDLRKSGLESEGGEYSVGNLVFKLLRRNGYTERIVDLKRRIYDKQYESIDNKSILKVLYLLDKLDEKMARMSYDGYTMNLRYNIDESNKKLDIKFNESDYDESGTETFDIDFNDNQIVAKWNESKSTPKGDYENKRDYKFNSVDELIKVIKQKFDVDR